MGMLGARGNSCAADGGVGRKRTDPGFDLVDCSCLSRGLDARAGGMLCVNVGWCL